MNVDYAKRFRIQEARRYFTIFSNVVRHKILPLSYPDGRYNEIEVFVGQHFADRMVDRSVDNVLVGKILSYTFEKHMDKIDHDVDTFIRYKDMGILLNSKRKEDGRFRIRINTVIFFNESSYIKEKKQMPLQCLDISIEDLMDYTPISLR
jgi:hypothetical protein